MRWMGLKNLFNELTLRDVVAMGKETLEGALVERRASAVHRKAGWTRAL